MDNSKENIKSRDTQEQFYPKMERRVIQIKLAHALLSALIFGGGMVVSTTLFINNVTTRIGTLEDKVVTINTITVPALQKIDADNIAKKDQLVHYTGVLTTNMKKMVEKGGQKWSSEVPEEFLDMIK
jgi:hypothetical protein